MKKKLLIFIIMALLMLNLVACGDDNTEIVRNEEGVIQEEINVQTSPNTDIQTEVTEVAEEVKRDAKEAYEAFLQGSEPLFFDYTNISEAWNYDNAKLLFMENTPYTLDEVLGIIDADEKKDDDSFSIGEVKYAYIDCGQDGEPELAVMFEKLPGVSLDISYQEAFIIKMIDDKLELCFNENFGYRAYLTIKENGCMILGESTGAAYYANKYKMVDKDGKYIFLYGENTSYNPYDLFWDKDDFDQEAYENLLSTSMYNRYDFREYIQKEDYEHYKKESKYVYYAVDDYYNPILDDASIYEPDNEYAKLYAQSGCTFVTPEEIDKLIAKRLEEEGVTVEMVEAKEVDWTVLREGPERNAEEPETVPYYMIDNPSWEHINQSNSESSGKKLKLTKVSQEANNITGNAEWFEQIGINMPELNHFSDQSFEYYLTGDEDYYPYKAQIVDLGGSGTIANLDFSNHRYADNLVEADRMFVEESLNYMVSDGFTLYVSISHNTYASSASHNAYVMALDMQNGYNVLWKSQPLVANADNFVVLDDFIVCGYGFTAEDDYLYILDKYTGETLDRIKLKTGPDYIYEVNDKLYVRTYDTNYVFDYEIIE